MEYSLATVILWRIIFRLSAKAALPKKRICPIEALRGMNGMNYIMNYKETVGCREDSGAG